MGHGTKATELLSDVVVFLLSIILLPRVHPLLALANFSLAVVNLLLGVVLLLRGRAPRSKG
jgi:hypothetical protein